MKDGTLWFNKANKRKPSHPLAVILLFKYYKTCLDNAFEIRSLSIAYISSLFRNHFQVARPPTHSKSTMHSRRTIHVLHFDALRQTSPYPYQANQLFAIPPLVSLNRGLEGLMASVHLKTTKMDLANHPPPFGILFFVSPPCCCHLYSNLL